ncbi:uncharacterized protein CYBJADRAFT_87631 [Cyberlindnera jadinii NRRL Y-1542]|uniref:Uncharacterized protein n=1 Tax=Cyberlindnera jadinii (strain ATCC 18201 / CBS 1600 / BCRC 20928 / JCM 3617 / NBRC 0987 / NRRL Y-1542) TaxID=983966 RepID=A0A1E4S2I9_CYBJN|nr:hypothetical protein CYBJADRAFT_87631 [Cyberlindnera jadinii NRRL Y-1542]ODV73650.1 hypothetical protein CYBJADRAFT_87631 [Cyberlindnera jadinii NRRL Y-1542]
MRLLLLFCAFAQFAQSIVISNDYFGELDESKSPASPFTIELRDELQSMGVLAGYEAREYQELDDVFLIPRSHITERVLNRLGFKDLVKYSKKFKFSNTLFPSHLDIIIPEQTVPYFVFNTSDSINVPKSQSRSEYATFLENSSPFTLPLHSVLLDYMLVLPIPTDFNPKSLMKDIISVSRQHLPMFVHAIQDTTPLIVFMFKSGLDNTDAQRYGDSPILGAHRYGLDKSQDMFFDQFAKTWSEDIAFADLLHGVFCTVNPAIKRYGYCLKIKDDMSSLALFPLFEHSQRALGGSHNTDEPSQSTSNNLEELVIPLSIIKENKAGLSETYSPRRTVKTQSTVKTPLTTLTRRSLSELDYNDRGEVNSAKIEIIGQKLEDRRRTKQLKDKGIKENAKTYVRSKLSKAKSDKKASSDGDSRGIRYSIIRTKPSSQRKPRVSHEDMALEAHVDLWTQQPDQHRQDSKQVVKVQSSATSHRNSTRTEEAEATEECEPITWFNVFHHSVFGKTKFCGVV